MKTKINNFRSTFIRNLYAETANQGYFYCLYFRGT